MKRLIIHILTSAVIVMCAESGPASPRPEPSSAPPMTYELNLVYVFEATPTEFMFVIGNSGFKTVASLERFIAQLPAGTTLRWSPGCERFGDEPLLSSEREMARFVSFCRDHQINFVLVPSG
jgi:hypothetical protein